MMAWKDWSKKKKGVVIAVVVFVALCILGAIFGEVEVEEAPSAPQESETVVVEEGQEPVAESEPESEPAPEPADDDEQADQTEASAPELEFGELLDLTTNDGVTVIKAKIEPSANNTATIDQNYYNVVHYIQDNDMNGINEIQYWAVADMTNGKEQKAISFTVPKDLIDQIKDGRVVANQLGDYVTDLWMIDSLK